MKILVSAASKQGSTQEIAEAIGTTLARLGHTTTILSPSEVSDAEGFDAAVLGSAVYAGHWLREAKDLIERCQPALVAIPVWTFSSGPLGDPPKPLEDPVDVADVLSACNTDQHMLFAGKLDMEKLGFAERALTRALRAPAGDFRDWNAIERWAEQISASLGG